MRLPRVFRIALLACGCHLGCAGGSPSATIDGPDDGGRPDAMPVEEPDGAPSREAGRDAPALSETGGGAQMDGPGGQPPDAGADAPVPAYCATNPWMGLEACGWPGPANTGPDLSKCAGGQLTTMGDGTSPTAVFEINQPGTVIQCQKIYGMLHITAQGVVVRNSYVSYDSGKTGEAANGTAPIVIDEGASATVDHVEINGLDAVHACIWNQGQAPSGGYSLAAHHVNCYGVDDGIFSWADTGYSQTTGDGFVIDDSFFHDFTTLTSNGHEDGFQTEGANDGVIRHNTFMLTTDADSCVAIWDSIRSSNNITVENNLMEGGGAAVYADDYDPSETAPQGGASVTNTFFVDNVFSNHVSSCVGQYFVWYSRPSEPYQGGPTDGWHRSGNFVLETGENVDDANPTVNGQLCQ